MSVPLACQGRPEAPWTAQTSRQYPWRPSRRARRSEYRLTHVLVPFDNSHNTLSLHPHSLLNVSFRGSLLRSKRLNLQFKCAPGVHSFLFNAEPGSPDPFPHAPAAPVRACARLGLHARAYGDLSEMSENV